MVAYQSCVNMNDTLRAKRNVFQVTGSPMVIWLIVSSIGQVQDWTLNFESTRHSGEVDRAVFNFNEKF